MISLPKREWSPLKKNATVRHLYSAPKDDSMIMYQGAPFSSTPNREVLYIPGQLIRHRRYGYRGVVVAHDHVCQADEKWYQSNSTQPDRQQPWYHILVHGSAQCTYTAQTSIEEDPLVAPVEHPLLAVFFAEFRDGLYLRNDTAWET